MPVASSPYGTGPDGSDALSSVVCSRQCRSRVVTVTGWYRRRSRRGPCRGLGSDGLRQRACLVGLVHELTGGDTGIVEHPVWRAAAWPSGHAAAWAGAPVGHRPQTPTSPKAAFLRPDRHAAWAAPALRQDLEAGVRLGHERMESSSCTADSPDTQLWACSPEAAEAHREGRLSFRTQSVTTVTGSESRPRRMLLKCRTGSPASMRDTLRSSARRIASPSRRASACPAQPCRP